jgi:hypothetical protein
MRFQKTVPRQRHSTREGTIARLRVDDMHLKQIFIPLQGKVLGICETVLEIILIPSPREFQFFQFLIPNKKSVSNYNR